MEKMNLGTAYCYKYIGQVIISPGLKLRPIHIFSDGYNGQSNCANVCSEASVWIQCVIIAPYCFQGPGRYTL